MGLKILAINPGSTSTKFGVYSNEELVFEKTLRHDVEELKNFEKIIDQLDFRKNSILNCLSEAKIELSELDAVVGRGGAMEPVLGGTYEVNERMLTDTRVARRGEHASNLGAHIAKDIAGIYGIPSFIVDPPAVDEMCDLARITGVDGFERESKFHALNQKAVAKRFSKEIEKDYDSLNLIVAHLGGGISVGAHEKGKIIDVNDAFTGDGPFSPERAGGLPTNVVMKLCLSGKYSKNDIVKMLVGKGGYVSYLGTNDGRKVSEMIDAGDEKAKLIYEAMAYQIAKSIASNAAVLKGNVDAIIITGGLAYDERFVETIKERINFIAPIIVYPGEDELLALTQGALRVLRKEEEVKVY
ncbi:butyrate kinase [Dethiosulfatibacter aminovorans DSM 17477]|uniref:Probable butyrate kinase n=1 Tax=Dethiosulfatibacter aminovorans DSM 17477 TaxID=1121476 RepID=A0A1M6EJY1_9FIRM|nr:butyrate kinase [Dethiosulfatibacter aminovorans]SHI85754.1 butyrate kinase [Dethiosulfatibacter aminovorans DSM 17477]